jgi:hypothetical protein
MTPDATPERDTALQEARLWATGQAGGNPTAGILVVALLYAALWLLALLLVFL